VSILDGRGVLITDFVDGTRPDRPGRALAARAPDRTGFLSSFAVIRREVGPIDRHSPPVGATLRR